MRIDEDRFARICSLVTQLQNEIRMMKSDNSANPAQLDPSFSPPPYSVCVSCDKQGAEFRFDVQALVCSDACAEKVKPKETA